MHVWLHTWQKIWYSSVSSILPVLWLYFCMMSLPDQDSPLCFLIPHGFSDSNPEGRKLQTSSGMLVPLQLARGTWSNQRKDVLQCHFVARSTWPDQAGLLQSCFYGKKPLTKLHETLFLCSRWSYSWPTHSLTFTEPNGSLPVSYQGQYLNFSAWFIKTWYYLNRKLSNYEILWKTKQIMQQIKNAVNFLLA
jgi:hypothetical protein